jgi:hypothetical protein
MLKIPKFRPQRHALAGISSNACGLKNSPTRFLESKPGFFRVASVKLCEPNVTVLCRQAGMLHKSNSLQL